MVGNQKISPTKITAKTILNKATGFIHAYDFTLNPYQGCEYGCSYCYAAAFSPNSQMRENWGNWVIVKENAAELLDRELKRWEKKNPHKPPSIYLSTVTDPYQPIEKQTKLTQNLLQVMVKYQPILVIQTRSPMINRDIDILNQFEYLRVNMSIPTGSERVRKDFEEKSPSVKSRLYAIGKLKHSISDKARFSVTITPLLPTFPEDETYFFERLQVVDRVVIQEFHATKKRSLVASTREAAIALKQKYAWWYNNEKESYVRFKKQLITMLPDLEILEGQVGFGYD